jgi:hypothetical protein
MMTDISSHIGGRMKECLEAMPAGLGRSKAT